MPTPISASPKALKAPLSKAATKRWGGPELRRLIATLKANLFSGHSDLQTAELMGLETGEYNALKLEMYEQDKADINGRSVEQTFIDYTIRQEGCIRELDTMLKDTKINANAKVGVIRAKSDIIDKMIDRGQEFGLIEKVPEKKQIIGGLLVHNMSMDELRGAISKQARELGSMADKYGSTDMMGNPIDTKALPAAKAPPTPASEATVTFAPVGKTGKAQGGLAKRAGGQATATKRARATGS